MTQFILPIFLVLAAVGVFFGFTKKELATTKDLKAQVVEYQKAVDKSAELLKIRDGLLDKRNKIQDTDLSRLSILMPNDVNSTKLVLEIQNLATNTHKLAFENPKYDPNKKVTGDVKIAAPASTDAASDAKTTPKTTTPRDATQAQKDYGTFELEFTVIGPYDNFINFISDLEKSLRIVDISQVDITPKEGSNLKYVVKIQTYWLKS
jgi:Tfp pilus assembly protein PilO